MFHVDVYKELSTTEARRLGNLHNYKARNLPLSFADTVRQARRLLFEMAGITEGLQEAPKENPKNYGKTFMREIVSDRSKKVDSVCDVSR